MRNRHERDILAEAIEQLKKQGREEPLPQEVLDEAMRRMAECGMRNAESGAGRLSLRTPNSTLRIFGSWHSKLAAAAVLLLSGYLAGRATSPDTEQLRGALTPSIAASLEPVLRQKLGEEMKDHYNVAMAAGYLRLREELGQQYRDDMTRFALQTLAASNATTNALLADLVQTIDTAQTQDRRRIAMAISEIEAKRIQDKTQLVAGIETLAYHTEDELSRTKKVLARFLVEGPSPEIELPQHPPTNTSDERSKQ